MVPGNGLSLNEMGAFRAEIVRLGELCCFVVGGAVNDVCGKIPEDEEAHDSGED